MCGINGRIDPAGYPVQQFLAERDRIAHRGPDDAGVWCNEDATVLLGHRRLSILDLSPLGHQPMRSPCNRFVIVFNGEVYNYVELRDELSGLGYQFQSESDTEVVLAAYRHWGQSCLSRFNGMFALAIWDSGNASENASLFLARDRAGKKPLFIAHRARTLAFASELKAVSRDLLGEVDLDALNHYLALGYIPSPLTIASGVRKLPPGYAARFFPEEGELTTWRWWDLPPSQPQTDDPQELVDCAQRLLMDAVRMRLRSDVPVGILLSGGLDSSLITACAAQSASGAIKTFTLGLPGSNLDETGYADIVARHFGTDHHLLEVQQPSIDIMDEIAPLIDEPLADSSLIPAFLISRLTTSHVKVALGGDGGDELFAGYGDYTTATLDAARLKYVPEWALRGISTLVGKLPPGIKGRNRLYALRGGAYQSLIWGSPFFDAASRYYVMSREVQAELDERYLAPELSRLAFFNGGIDPVDSMTRTHFHGILADDFLMKVDQASMAAGLEMRCPFLDVNLIEFAFGKIPSSWKVWGGEGRRLQRLLGSRLLPPALDTSRKQGFSIPLDDWLRRSDCAWFHNVVDTLRPYVSAHIVDDLVNGLQVGRANGARLFNLMVLSVAIKNVFGHR
ncbi:MAG: asparagine synthase (glutamine-hydrolyzing) [Aquabacterium sp.]|uniref:asparagine synthase (glutamine-hydrolyzing) n=1 Tax=Aquabacterium sp. TaxID=1872578 RepID=UPI0025BFC756|nr:asparagine synthase (glutamine-hydrolyzing) [Aquabacterium sp.]MBI5925025.1 asparagine synthase (glutamine-hydrolyzing) [Aquabacterium sp.]